MLTLEQLQEIERRWAKTTPGPWIAKKYASDDNIRIVEIDGYGNTLKFVTKMPLEKDCPDAANNARAIANSPADIQALLQEVRWLSRMKDVLPLLQEVRRLNRMVELSIEWHEKGHNCDDCHIKYDCCLMGCTAAWRKYLESEVAENG